MSDTQFKKGKKPGPGRPKGMPNKVTQNIKEMIECALSEVGGKDYLVKQALDNPTAFLALVKSILPKDMTTTIKGDVGFVLLPSKNG